MATSTSLRYGEQNVEFMRSPTKVAIRSSVGHGRSMGFTIEPMFKRHPVERLGRLGRFEIIDIQASESVIANVLERLGRSSAIRSHVSVYHTSDDEVPFVPEGTIFLSFEDGVSDRDIEDLLTRYDLGVAFVTKDKFYTVYSQNTDTDALQVSRRLQDEDIVSLAEPDLVTPRQPLDIDIDDKLLSRQWHLENKGEFDGTTAGFKKGADARVIAAWSLLGSLGEKSAVVAVIDDGVDVTHPDFQGKAIHPWDFVRGSDNVQPAPDLNAVEAGDWHGTACAGVAVGLPGGGDIVGAIPNAKLLPVRVPDHLSPPEVEKWFQYVTEKGAWVVSCSWDAAAKCYPLPERISKAISHCAKQGRNGKGCVVVFAAGNTGSDINDPPNSLNGFAIHPDVIAVAASTSMDRRASYSDMGKEIAVCAPSGGFPGWNIATSDVTGTYVDANGVERSSGYTPGAYYTEFTGTSSACPLVAGVCSLVLSANPELITHEVRRILEITARKIGQESDYQNSHSKKFGYGCVNAEAAVAMALEAKQNRDVLAS